MTDTQFFLLIGLPVFTILVSVAAVVVQLTKMNERITSLESAVYSRINSLEPAISTRITSLEWACASRLNGIETQFDTLIGKVVEIDNRLTVKQSHY